MRHILVLVTLPFLLAATGSPEVQAQVTPNDPLYPLQQPYLARIGVPDVWNTTKGSSSLKIAVIAPGGVRASHEDLVSKTRGSRLQDDDAHEPIRICSLPERDDRRRHRCRRY
jgi:hypothetical protein